MSIFETNQGRGKNSAKYRRISMFCQAVVEKNPSCRLIRDVQCKPTMSHRLSHFIPFYFFHFVGTRLSYRCHSSRTNFSYISYRYILILISMCVRFPITLKHAFLGYWNVLIENKKANTCIHSKVSPKWKFEFQFRRTRFKLELLQNKINDLYCNICNPCYPLMLRATQDFVNPI